jgi:hypothetical protein
MGGGANHRVNWVTVAHANEPELTRKQIVAFCIVFLITLGYQLFLDRLYVDSGEIKREDLVTICTPLQRYIGKNVTTCRRTV